MFGRVELCLVWLGWVRLGWVGLGSVRLGCSGCKRTVNIYINLYIEKFEVE